MLICGLKLLKSSWKTENCGFINIHWLPIYEDFVVELIHEIKRSVETEFPILLNHLNLLDFCFFAYSRGCSFVNAWVFCFNKKCNWQCSLFVFAADVKWWVRATHDNHKFKCFHSILLRKSASTVFYWENHWPQI